MKCCRQLLSLQKKNWVLRTRVCCGCALWTEIILPPLLVLLLGLIKFTIPNTDISAAWPQYSTIPSLDTFYDIKIAQKSQDSLFLTCDRKWFREQQLSLGSGRRSGRPGGRRLQLAENDKFAMIKKQLEMDEIYVKELSGQNKHCTLSKIAIFPESSSKNAKKAATDYAEWLKKDLVARYGGQFDPKHLSNTVLSLKDKKDFDDYVVEVQRSPNDYSPLSSAIMFASADDAKWEYTIRFNQSIQVPATQKARQMSLAARAGGQATGQYLSTSFMSFQQSVQAFARKAAPGSDIPTVRVASNFPTAGYTLNTFWFAITFFYGLVMCIGLVSSVAFVTKEIVQEKENRVREAMFIMSLSRTSYYLSWLFTFMTSHAVSALLMTLASMVSLFSKSSFLLILLYFYVFLVSSFSFSFFLSSFFARARVAQIVGLISWFGTAFVCLAVQLSPMPLHVLRGLSVFPVVAFANAGDVFGQLEGNNIGVDFNALFYEGSTGWTLFDSFVFLIFDCVVYFLLGIYFDQVIPSNLGVTQPPWFFFLPSYWCPSMAKAKAEDDDQNPTYDSVVEPVSIELEEQEADNRTLSVRRLRRVFKNVEGKACSCNSASKVAVDNLTMTFYEGQISALLGHNGAGKTTTISMLTGMLPASGGTATIQGLDIHHKMAEIRRTTGFCPQHNILWDDLTVKEHMDIYAELKGLDPETREEECLALIVAVGLHQKKDKRSKSLSGGMKRKLSLAIALMGQNTKVVLLDEPTSGMDPWSRRSTWDIIKSFREGRIIVLTTHFMDEADLLGDRIAIMAAGRLICCGSSLFLKQKYGVGYSLTMVLAGADPVEQAAAIENLIEIVNEHVPTEPPTVSGREITFRLASTESDKFAPLLRALSAVKIVEDVAQPVTGIREGGLVGDIGLSITTLEEVFLRVGHETGAHGADPVNDSEPASESKTDDSAKLVGQSQDSLAWRHFGAMMTKRSKYFMRDCQSWCCQLVLPLVMLIFGVLMYKVLPQVNFDTRSNGLELSTSQYNLQTPPKSGILPLPLPYTTGFDPETTCSASCEWWCEQEHYPWNNNTAEMCVSLRCGGCKPCMGHHTTKKPKLKTPSNSAKTSGLASQTNSVQWWVDKLVSITPHVTVEPLPQSNKIEYLLQDKQMVQDQPYVALQNYLMRTGGPSSDTFDDKAWLVGGDSWKPITTNMETCELYLYRYQDVNCPDTQASVFAPATKTKWKKGEMLVAKGTWAVVQYGQRPETFKCDENPPAGSTCYKLGMAAPTSYSCQISNGKLDATQVLGAKPDYAQEASRFGAYVYNTIPGYTKEPAPIPGSSEQQGPGQMGKGGRRLQGFSLAACDAIFNMTNPPSSMDALRATCHQYMERKVGESLRKQCSAHMQVLQKSCKDILRSSNKCEDALPQLCKAVVANGQCGDLYRAKVCCASCKRMNSGGSFDVTVLPNVTSTHGAPVFANLFWNSLLSGLRADKSVGEDEFDQHPNTTDLPVPAELRVTSRPFAQGIAFKALTNSSWAFLLGIIISIALAFVPPTFALFIVREKEFKQRHQQTVSGLSNVIYWASNFTYDFISLMAVLGITVIMFFIFNVEGFVDTAENAAAFILIFVFFSLSVIPFIYVFTFIFKKHTAAWITLIFITMLSGVAMIVAGWILDTIENTKKANFYLGYFVYRLFPPYNMGRSIMELSLNFVGKKLKDAGIYPPDTELNTAFHWNTTGASLVYMGSGFVFYSLLVVLLETNILCILGRTRSVSQVGIKGATENPDDDVDVRRERDRVLVHSATPDLEAPLVGDAGTCTDTVQVRDVYKNYGSVKAVRGITFGIDVGTCFGLLGINGAGKTTTFSMLTGEVLPSHGQLIVDGHDVVQEPDRIKRLLGYCPQFDALWDKLTAREHLQLYAAIKGVPKDTVEQEVNSILARMGLNEFADKLAGGYSGGNKRKLSVGIALIGNPKIVFLDEPSTGMDPVARRQMWDIISQVTTQDKSCCTVLTTHSMEECEALCTRICIMVAGRLKCIGTGQHLKGRFGKSFTMEIALELPTDEEKDNLQQNIYDLLHNKPVSPKAPKKETEMTTIDKSAKPASKMKSIARSITLSQNASISSLFKGDASRLHTMLQALDVKSTFPWFHASLQNTPGGGLEADMSARDAGIFIMERERLLCFKGFMQQNFPRAVLKEEFGNTLRYQIPTVDPNGAKRDLADMFGLVESDKDRLRIQNYAIGQMSLEEIFNTFASGEDNPDNERYKIATLQGKAPPGTAPGAALVTIDPSKAKHDTPTQEIHSKVTTIAHEEL